MFGVQFYPTPTKLVDRMLDLVDWERVKFALEPSAGKGDIAQGIRERMKQKKEPFQLDCVEIDSDLRAVLSFVKSDPNGAYNILDIAKYQGEPEFDEILKNVALRLAAYENTGLEPEEIIELKARMEGLEK